MESMPEANGEVINQRTVQVFVPYKYLYLFDEPRMAHVSFEGSNNASYNCDIIRHNAELIHREDGNYFMAIATMCTQEQNVPVLQKYMKVDVRIIVSTKRYGSRCSDKLYPNTAYYLHKGSFSHPCGNPMACKSTLEYFAKSLSRELFKSMQGLIVCSKYNKVHS